MDLNSVRLFVSVVRKGSISAAARELGVPVATVSRRLAALESSLGLRLLERSTRKMRVTDAGATLYEYSSRGVEEMEAGFLALQDQEQNLKGCLRLSMPPSFEPVWPLIQQFQISYPNVDVELFTTERRIDFIEDGVDLALRIGELASQSAVARRVGSYRHQLVASPAFMEGRKVQSPAELADVPCAAWARKDQKVQWMLGEELTSISAYFKANDYPHMQYLALNHRCVTELPPYLANPHLAEGRLVAVLPDYPMPVQDINLMFPSRKSLSRISRAFIDHCVEHFMDCHLL